MPIARAFLGWNRPALELVADHLLAALHGEPVIALEHTVVVLPVAHAGRRLLEILVERSEQSDRPLLPPDIVTPNYLPEGYLYRRKKPFANDLTQQLAWVEALKQSDKATLHEVVRECPAGNDNLGWLSLGAMLADLHTSLAADRHDCTTVLEYAAELPHFSEHARWKALAALQASYLRILDALGLWDRQTARLKAIEFDECRCERPIVLAGTVDLNQTHRLMLRQVADNDGDVTALVFAPSKLQGQFDEFGCLRVEKWSDAPIPLRDDQIEQVDGPGDQADAAICFLSSLGGAYPAEDITVGTPDPSLVVPLTQRLENFNVPCRVAAGNTISQTSPYRLLSAVADCLAADRFRDFETLVRHPAVGSWLRAKGVDEDWLIELDEYAEQRIPKGWGRLGQERSAKHLAACVRALVVTLLGSLLEGKRPLREWVKPIVDLLGEVYGERAFDDSEPADHKTAGCLAEIANCLQGFGDVPDSLAPTTTADEALRIVLAGVSGTNIASVADASSIALLGWLDLPLDDAPVLVLAGMNDGIVPKSQSSHPFLPDALRTKLGIEDNEQRYARDAYALTLMTHTRDVLRIIVGRRSIDSEALAPSRLLFACDDAALAARAQRWFSDNRPASRPVLLPPASYSMPGRSAFTVPPAAPLSMSIAGMNVTEFKEFLQCPYRYYLRRCLKLDGMDTRRQELDGLAFGSLLHDVLNRFAAGDCADSTSAARIAEQLIADLETIAADLYGKDCLPAIRLQLEVARRRLLAFSHVQAERAREGWRILHHERTIDGQSAPFVVDDRPMYLRGRIDRIDRHEETGRIAVLDYKSSAAKPDKAHREQGEWIDLQLPLYRHLVRALELPEPDQLGYFLLPQDSHETAVALADWTPDQLADADAQAAHVIRQIRRAESDASVFGQPQPLKDRFTDPFADLCLVGVRTRRVAATEED